VKPLGLAADSARRLTRASLGLWQNGKLGTMPNRWVSNEHRLDVGRHGGTNYGSH
jgi:hypothetical protein